MNSIVYCNYNQHKHEGYTTDLNDGNFQDYLNAAITVTSIEENHIYSGSIYSNINN